MFKRKILLQVLGLLKEGEKNKDERQDHKLDKEQMGKETLLWGQMVLGARWGAVRTGAAVTAVSPWPPGSHALGIAVGQEVPSSPCVPGASSGEVTPQQG